MQAAAAMNLLRALATISSMTLVSRVLGLVRDFFIARVFGAGIATDAFFVAFRIPNLLRRLFAEGAFSQAFVPILGEYRSRQTPEETRALVDSVASVLFIALVVAAALGVLAAPLIVYVTAPGFSAEPGKFALTVAMLRVTFPYILFISLVALAAGILNTWNRFAIPAFTPVLLNVSFIVAAAFFADRFHPPVLVLAWAVFVGGVLQLALQLPALGKLGMRPRWSFNPRHPGVGRILKLMGPAVFGVSVSQLSLLINTIFASFLPSGSVSWLYYADRLMEFPAGMLGVALGTILLPSLSKYHASADNDEYAKLLDWGLRVTLLLAVPAAVALGVLALPLIATLFGHALIATEDAKNYPEAERVLKAAVARDRENPFAWYQLGVVYAANGDLPRARLASAEQQVLSNRMPEALRSAETAEAALPTGSPDWLRAQDIAFQARAAIEQQKKRK